jgi:hypothetical protein
VRKKRAKQSESPAEGIEVGAGTTVQVRAEHTLLATRSKRATLLLRLPKSHG